MLIYVLVIDMGLKVDNKVTHNLTDDIATFFSLPEEYANPPKVDTYESTRNKIYSLDLDVEEKAGILDAISKYNSTNSTSEKNKLKKQIEKFIDDYDLR